MRCQCRQLVSKNRGCELISERAGHWRDPQGHRAVPEPMTTLKPTRLRTGLFVVDEAFGERILPIDRAVANEWGRLNAMRPLPVIDGLLAATAKIHRMTMVTRNTADIADLGVRNSSTDSN